MDSSVYGQDDTYHHTDEYIQDYCCPSDGGTQVPHERDQQRGAHGGKELKSDLRPYR